MAGFKYLTFVGIIMVENTEHFGFSNSYVQSGKQDKQKLKHELQ